MDDAKTYLPRTALRTLISAIPGFVVVAEAHCLEVGADLARQHQPYVILVSGSMLAEDEDGDLGEMRNAALDACILVVAQGRTPERWASASAP